MAVCRICNHQPLVEPGICQGCATKLGIAALPPPRRKSVPCQRCNAMRFIRVVPREYSAYGNQVVTEAVAPMTATQPPLVMDRTFGAGKDVYAPLVRAGYGVLELYICAGRSRSSTR